MTDKLSDAMKYPTCSAEFRLSITKALGDQLSDAIQKLEPSPLDDPTLSELKAEPGVYQLYRQGVLAYIGKADKSLPDRLRQHQRKISGRENISSAEMAFTCLYVAEDLSAMAPETLLIKRYQGDGQVPWNTNGFGNKDPGRNRDNTMVKANHFDAHFPIDLEVSIEVPAGCQPINQVLKSLKEVVPFLLRYDKALKSKSGVALTEVTIRDGKITARQAFKQMMASLPPEWQLTALPGYAILYREAKSYDSALALWRRTQDGAVVELAGPRRFDTKGGAIPFDTDDEED